MPAPAVLSRMLRSALWYAEQGWRVLPLHHPIGSACSCERPTCGHAGKHPRTRRGVHDATVDPDQIRAWWTEWPDAGIGIATGPESGLVVIDVDPRNGGDDALDDLRARVDLGETPTALTGGGGLHLFYRWPAGSTNLKGKLGQGIDVKAAGGYVVAAPSVHASGRPYAWEASSRPEEIPLADLPPALLAMLRGPSARAQGAAPTSGDAAASLLGRAFLHAGMLGRPLGQGRVAVTCPWTDEHTSGEPGDSSTAIFPARDGSSLGGFACLHSHCAGRSWRDVLDALPREAVARARQELPHARPSLRAVPDSAPRTDSSQTEPGESVDQWGEVRAPAPTSADWTQSLIRSQREPFAVLACPSNLALILRHDPAWVPVLAYDEFRDRVVKRQPPEWPPEAAVTTADKGVGDWLDSDAERLVMWFRRSWGIATTAGACMAAVQVAAESRRVHPVRDYLTSLRWDGTLRLSQWLTTYLGVQPSEYAEDVGRTFLVGAVARVMKPGCKLDTMLILEGAQGAGKSSALRTLFGQDWHSDTPIDLQSKDRFTALLGRWCVEHAELDGHSRAEKERVKAYISSAVDTYRRPYGRVDVSVPRQCVFAGTTNQDHYIDDETGGRRFNGVRVGAVRYIDLEALAAARDQLWAEAHEAYQGGAQWWPDASLVTSYRAEQSARQRGDEWEAPILRYLEGRSRTTVADLLADALEIDKGRWTPADQGRVRRIMAALGWEQRRERHGAGKVRVYYPPHGTA